MPPTPNTKRTAAAKTPATYRRWRRWTRSYSGSAWQRLTVRRFRPATPRCLFALESISKVFTAALAMEQVGPRAFHRKVGADPTGAAFNSVLALELHNDKPMSPMVNAGAMTSTSLVSATDADDRWRQILQIQSDFAGRRSRSANRSARPSGPPTFTTARSRGCC